MVQILTSQALALLLCACVGGVDAESAHSESESYMRVHFVGVSHGVLCVSDEVPGFAMNWDAESFVADWYDVDKSRQAIRIPAGATVFPFAYYQGDEAYVVGVESFGFGRSRMVMVATRLLKKEHAFPPLTEYGVISGCDEKERARLLGIMAEIAENLELVYSNEIVYPDYVDRNPSGFIAEVSREQQSVSGALYLPPGKYVFVLIGNGINRLSLGGPDWNMCGEQLDPGIRETRVLTRVHTASGGHEAFAAVGEGCLALGIFGEKAPRKRSTSLDDSGAASGAE